MIMDNGSDEEPLQPAIEIIEQPKPRGYRFRYGCEGKTAGCIPGEKTTMKQKTSPSFRISNVPTGSSVVVVMSCVSADQPYRPHPHKLVGKDCDKGVCTLTMKRTNIVQLQHIGIQCVKKKEIGNSLEMREQIKVDPFQAGYYEADLQYDMKKVRIAIQAYITIKKEDQTTQYIPIPPVVTNPIYDQKGDNELMICRVDRTSGSAKGGQEVFLLCEKVSKEDIQIQFSEETQDGDVTWESWGQFAQNDVHKQFAVVFKTPPYKDQKITSSREVLMRLYRPSDEAFSEQKIFTYQPNDPDPYGVNAKRKRKMDYSNGNPIPNVPALAAFQQQDVDGRNEEDSVADLSGHVETS